MTERYGQGDEGGRRPSGRGAITERLAGKDRADQDIDLTDEAARRDHDGDATPGPEDERAVDGESAGSFEPAAPIADPPAEATSSGSTSIFDADERAKREDQEPAGDEPAPADSGEARDREPGAAPPSLLESLDAAGIRNRFLDIQAGFVDEPRQAVQEAGRFVDGLLDQVQQALTAQRGQLAGPTAEGSTEDLRLTLRAYRQFVDRLLSLAG
jgi:hypothetical protein